MTMTSRGHRRPRKPEDPHPHGPSSTPAGSWSGPVTDVTMPEVARRALVSEATAYRYFPDLTSLLAETLDGLWPGPDEALAPVASSTDPVERVRLRLRVPAPGRARLPGSGAGMISGTITGAGLAPGRPGIRFGLIDQRARPVRRRP